MRLLVDSNVILDYLQQREPFHTDARKLILLGYVSEVELWVSGSQMGDITYIFTAGGKRSYADSAKEALKKLRKCVNVYNAGGAEIDAALDSPWLDIEDAYLYQAALSLKANAIITRDRKDFELSSLPVMDTSGFFAHLEEEGITYEEIDLALAQTGD